MEILEDVRAVLGQIDLDPASCEFAQKRVKAKRYFTKQDDGLQQRWFGNVFLNPPYQMPAIEQFTDKLLEELPVQAEGNRIAREKLCGETAIGEWNASLPKEKGGRGKTCPSKRTSFKELGLSKTIAYKLEHLAELKALIDETVEEAMAELEFCTRQRVLNELPVLHCRQRDSSILEVRVDHTRARRMATLKDNSKNPTRKSPRMSLVACQLPSGEPIV